MSFITYIQETFLQNTTLAICQSPVPCLCNNVISYYTTSSSFGVQRMSRRTRLAVVSTDEAAIHFLQALTAVLQGL